MTQLCLCAPAQLCQDRLCRPSAAGVHYRLLGGTNLFPADAPVADELRSVDHRAELAVLHSRAFTRRALELSMAAGLDQVLDVGSGMPIAPLPHRVLRASRPGAAVVYADPDPVVAMYTEPEPGFDAQPGVRLLAADLTDPAALMSAPVLTETLHLGRPVTLLLTWALHFLPDELDPYTAVAHLLDALAPGSHVVISRLGSDGESRAMAASTEVYRRAGIDIVPRTRAEATRFTEGWELLEPGVVLAHDWHRARTDTDNPLLGLGPPRRHPGGTGLGGCGP